MTKRYTEESYSHLNRAGYIIFRFKRICLVRHYSKNNAKAYFKDLGELFVESLIALITGVLFPIRLLIMIYDFIPKLRLIYPNENDSEDIIDIQVQD